MKHLKRMIAFIAVLAMSVSCVGSVYAANGSSGPQASETLAMYAVWLDPGTKSGELKITFDVTATGWADSLGVAYFEIHRASDDKLIDTVHSSTSSGLKSEGFTYTYTYTHTSPGIISGVYYYAIIAVSAKIGSAYDSRTLRTVSVKAP